MWHPSPARLAAWRAAVVADRAAVHAVVDAPAFTAMFGPLDGDRLRRAPSGYRADDPDLDLLRLKDITFGRGLADADACSPTCRPPSPTRSPWPCRCCACWRRCRATRHRSAGCAIDMSDGTSRRPRPVPPGPGQESVWDYPRPPRVEPVAERVRVVVGETTVADTTTALRVLETAGAPVYYVPRGDVRMDVLCPSAHRTWCEWKGEASYWSLHDGTRDVPNVAWTYEHPETWLRGPHRPSRLLRRPGRRGVAGRRAGHPAAGPVLRRVGHLAHRGSLQG